MALDLNGGPSWSGSQIDSPVIVNSTGQEYYKEPTFYALAHFAKFVSPDSVRINVVVENKPKNLETVAFVRPDNSTVLVVINTSENSVVINLDDSVAGKLQREAAPHSILSFVWWN